MAGEGEFIGPYRIVGRLGKGGMGVVHRAIAPDGREVAVKVLAAELRAEALVKRFEREARIRIDHPNVAPLLDAGVAADGAPYLVLELLRGETLAERLDRGRPSPAELVFWAIQVCAGLEAAHRQGIVHRDVKPSNVFLCDDGAARLLDFGVALVDDGHTKLTQGGAVPGTVGYLSPEQARGRVAVDARSDVWSLGATLYEGLTGVVPFQQGSPLATLVATLIGELVPVRRRAPDVPPALAHVVERALAREREARYGSAASFGAALEATQASLATATPPRSAPGTAPPAAGAEGIARTPSIRPGEQRVIVVLFADGVRDGALFEQAVAEQGGAALHVAGGRALGLFGTEAWEGDEASRAARAALTARGAAERLAIGSGWAAGTDAGIAGAALSAAERAAAAAPRGIAVDAETARALRDTHPLEPLSGGIFELRDPATEPVGPKVSDEIATVDREAERAELLACLRTVLADRRPLVVLLSGPAGIGKTRLRTDLERHLRTGVPEATLLGAQGAPRRRHADLALVTDLLAGSGSTTRHAAPPSSSRSGGDLQVQRDRVRAEVLAELGSILARGPLVLVLEDLHWADDASIELLEDLIDRHPGSPLLVLATARPEVEPRDPAPFAGRDVVTLGLRGLGRSDVATLAARVAGRPLPEETLAALADRTGGNPFFVVQSVRAWLDAGLDADAPLPLPATVEATVLARLDHLPHDERDLCRRASIWGRPFAATEARAVGALDPEPALAALVRRDLIAVRGRGKGSAFAFRSPLVADVAYRSLGEDLRRELHRSAGAHLAGAWIAEAATSVATPATPAAGGVLDRPWPPGSDPEEAARHLELGGEAGPAALAYTAAVRATVGRGDVQSALRCAERALALGAPEDARFDLHALRVDALRFLGRKQEQARALADMLDAARTDAERARALSERTVSLWRSGDLAAALASAEEATAAGRASGDRDAITLARGRAFLVLEAAGRASEADQALAEAVAASRGADPSLRAMALSWRAHHLAQRGDLGERLAAFAELAELYDELGDRRRAAGARANLADVYNRVGAYEEAAEALEAALADCRGVGHRTMEGYTLLNLAYARTGAGRPAEAFPLLDEAAALAAATGEARLAALATLYRARAHLAEGHAPAAAAATATATAAAAAAATATATPDLTCAALALAARAALRLGDAAKSLDLSARAMELYDTLGRLEEDEADVFLARIEALRAAGDEHGASALRTRAVARIDRLASAIADEHLRARFLAAPSHVALRS